MGYFEAFAQYPNIHSNRPRIYADSARFAWMQSNLAVAGDFQTSYNEFEYRYNNWWINDPQLYLLGSDSTQWTWDWGSQYSQNEAIFTIFMYKLNEDSLSLKRCRFLAQKAIDTLNSVDYSTMAFYDKEDFVRRFSDVGSLLIDWCYDDLPDTLLHELVRAQYKMNREFMNFFILSAAGNSYVSSHNTWNNIYCNQNALVLHEAAGLSILQQDTVTQWYQAVYDKHINGFIPCWTYYRDDDGGWNWGAAYSMWSLIDQFQLFENMRIGTDKNFYNDLPWIENSINQYWYFMQPDNVCIHLGDGQTPMYADRVTYRHASIYNDPRSIWLSQKYSTPQYYFSTPVVFQKLMYKDFTIAPISKPNPPLNWWSDKVGLSESRSSWDSAATMVTFFNSPNKRAAHEHRDNNSFTVFKHKPLLLDAGYYDTYNGTHYRNYYSRTIAHNSICVFDSTDQYMAFGQAASNDGGQIESSPLQNYNEIFLPQNQRGEWVQYAVGNGYQYNVADAQLSYDSTKLDFFRRKILYLNPHKMIVLDHVHLKNVGIKQRDIAWIGHFAEKPTMSGTITQTSVPNHIETYNGNEYFAQNGKGNIAIKTLIPNNVNTTLVGGAGYEFWVNGTNYPPLSLPDSNTYETGKWRIEVRPDTLQEDMRYLHTINIGDSLNIASAGGKALKSFYSIGADWQDTIYVFSADGAQDKTWHELDSVEGGRTVHFFVADMVKWGTCAMFIFTSAGVENLGLIDTNGIFQGDISLPSGKQSITLMACYMSVENGGATSLLQVYPNPAQTFVTISLPSKEPVEIEIYNAQGILKKTALNSFTIDIADLAVGIYFVKVKQGDKEYLAKFIKN